jgi:hypothetical protein
MGISVGAQRISPQATNTKKQGHSHANIMLQLTFYKYTYISLPMFFAVWRFKSSLLNINNFIKEVTDTERNKRSCSILLGDVLATST